MQIVGILNCSPDSYYEGGRFGDPKKAIEYGLRLFEEGADILDIGGESTRPGSNSLSAGEEMERVLPVIQGIRAYTDKTISVDTYKPEVAEAGLKAGANWINDITGLASPLMQQLACSTGATVCIMHMYGTPHSIPDPSYPQGVVQGIIDFFHQRVSCLEKVGIQRSQMILDPGIGGGAFGKTPDENLQIIKHLDRLIRIGYPLLISLSRKSLLQKILQKPASEVLSTTLALNTIALLAGVSYIRVHDVAEHKDVLAILRRLEAVE
jgi:dihydropteroate synthase